MPQFQTFDQDDKIVETTKVTTGYFSDGGGILEGSDMETASKKKRIQFLENGNCDATLISIFEMK